MGRFPQSTRAAPALPGQRSDSIFPAAARPGKRPLSPLHQRRQGARPSCRPTADSLAELVAAVLSRRSHSPVRFTNASKVRGIAMRIARLRRRLSQTPSQKASLNSFFISDLQVLPKLERLPTQATPKHIVLSPHKPDKVHTMRCIRISRLKTGIQNAQNATTARQEIRPKPSRQMKERQEPHQTNVHSSA